ncbi:extracellular solute-binding protein [Paenibacillus sp. UNC451MF]|uniref:extracellular solute-binding protein n=1 Tax=Paenibacillus sp. UNC451MF TaxID=1449063 RepID=UPI00048D30E8|nr:extracellular solute-binding protein [Paenibacillus sp. UNC451MF]
MKKKSIAASLSSAILLTSLIGCSSSEGQPAAPSADAGTTNKKMKLTFLSANYDKVTANGYANNQIKEKFNVDIDILPIPNDANARKDAILLKIASGEIPDTWADLPFTAYNKLVDQGAVAEVPQEMLEKYAPKYMAWLKKYLGNDPFIYTRRNGKNYSLPIVWSLGPTWQVLGIRQDWLDKVGLSKTPESLDDLEVMLRKFRNDDPDGNGKKDTYGWTVKSEAIENLFSPIFGAFDLYPGAFVDRGGKLVRGEVEPGAKEALTLLNKWYKEDLIDPEFVLNKQKNVEDKVISEKIGMVQDAWYKFIPRDAFNSGLFYEKTKEKNPNAKWTTISGPKGPAGKLGITQRNPIPSSGVQLGVHMSKDPDKMIRYIQLWEERSFNPEFYEKLVYGEKGKTYKINADGDFEYIPPYDKEEERIKFGIGDQYGTSFNDYDLQAPYMTKSKLMPIRKQAESVAKGEYDVMSPVELPIYYENKDRLDQLTIKNFIDFITGKRPISQFNDFVDEWNKSGGSKVMEEAQKEYEKMKKK